MKNRTLNINKVRKNTIGLVLIIACAMIFSYIGCNSDSNDSSDVPTELTVSAGTDQTVNIGATVTLSGSGSSSASEDTLTYSWAQTSGLTTTLGGSNTLTPTFSAGEPGSYVFTLSVTNGTLTSTDSITVTAQSIQSGNYLVDIYYKDLV